jgi:hypothetical protein
LFIRYISGGILVNLDDFKVLASATVGIGNLMLEIDLILKCGVSLASLVYIILKIKQLIKKDREDVEK